MGALHICKGEKQKIQRAQQHFSNNNPTLFHSGLALPTNPFHPASLDVCGRHGSLSDTSSLAHLQLTFQLYQDGIRCNLSARDVEFADIGAVIRALSSPDATREKGEVVRAVMGRAALHTEHR